MKTYISVTPHPPDVIYISDIEDGSFFTYAERVYLKLSWGTKWGLFIITEGKALMERGKAEAQHPVAAVDTGELFWLKEATVVKRVFKKVELS